MKYRKMTRRERLAAEYFGYSLANYADHLAVDNVRFTKLMPAIVDQIERACDENWPVEQTAKTLDVKPDEVPDIFQRFREALEMVDAPNPSEAFRLAVREQIQRAAANDLNSAKKIDDLVIQICYAASDMGCLLEWEGTRLSDYSEWLRRERDSDYSGIDLPNLPSISDENDAD
jgi:hypothetical protein